MVGRVLVLGFDPRTIPGHDPEPVVAAIERGERRLVERGISYRMGLVPLDETTEARIAELLQLEAYDCVVVGGGIRKEEQLLELFEFVINLVRRHAPDASIAFNTSPARRHRRRSPALVAVVGADPAAPTALTPRREILARPHGIDSRPSALGG